MHKPVGRVHFVVFETFTSAYLFQIAREKSCDYLFINNIDEKHYKFWQGARAFSSFNWLAETDFTFVKFKLFQDQSFQNHSAKNLEICKDWFYTSLLKIQ